ncbi:MAG: type II toxin-antitoxin system VapC family toxin [Acidobacteriota bacterium]
MDPIQAEAGWLAGQNFLVCHRAGGPREPLIPDFLIAAPAQVQPDRLAALDRGYYRTCFPDLILLCPIDSKSR